MRLPALLPFLLVSAVLSAGATSLERHAPAGVRDAFVGQAGVVADPLDSARAEMEIGRYWHAARILREAREQAGLEPEGLLLLARAEAGYLHWQGVRDVLDGAGWLDRVEGGRGWRLLARALEEEGARSEAARAWEHYLASPRGVEDPDRPGLLARLARARWQAGGAGSVRSAVDSLVGSGGPLASWLALELMSGAVERGDTAAIRVLRRAMTEPETRRRSWEATARARLTAGDSAGAESAYRSALDSLDSGASRSRAWTAVGELRLAAADTAAARAAFLEALDEDPRGAAAVASANRLLSIGGLDASRALQAARALDRGGEHRRALEAHELHASLSGSPLPPATRLERARLLSLVPGRHDEAIEAFRELDGRFEDGSRAVRHLVLWMDLRRRQGRSGDVATLRRWILERHPASPEAVEIVFFRGDAAHDRGALDEALSHYRSLQRMNSSLDRSGLARMRMAQIHLGRGEPDDALAVYRAYLDEYPEGRRWDEATYWSGRILLQSGDAAGAEPLLRSIGRRNPLSYYAVQAAALLGEPYRLDLPGGPSPGPLPEELVRGLRTADRLAAAGLDEGRDAVLGGLRSRALDEPDGVVLTFARELLERGFAIEAVNLAWTLRERGAGWSRALLELAYPFPYRKMVVRAARERGVDPVMVAALIRQESAFDHDIVSVAGAVGLMQVMPATGRELARREGPADFSVASLEAPEINLHLGTRFFRDMWDRYDGEWTLVLSAYNAGPSRASRWRRFPEASDPIRFTERIPFGETRDYVKQVTRNLALYRALYGDV